MSDRVIMQGRDAVFAALAECYVTIGNPSVAQSVLDMIPLYLSEGAAEGIRGDIAFAQSCLKRAISVLPVPL